MAWCQYVRVCGCVIWIVFQFHHLFTVNVGMKATMWAAHSPDRRFYMNIRLIPCLSHKRIVKSSSIRSSIFCIQKIKITFLESKSFSIFQLFWMSWTCGLVLSSEVYLVVCVVQNLALFLISLLQMRLYEITIKIDCDCPVCVYL